LFLILHAFSSGTTALTGVEAISNGTTAFNEPRGRNAGITLGFMSAILGFLFLAITFLSGAIGAVPSESETVISQLARTVHGSQFIYFATITATTVILIMAANTSFAGFPRLAAILAADGYLPRQLAFRGSRLVHSRGIAVLAAIACGLIVVFKASVTALVPLYAIGVFLSFTLAQAGMSHRWWKPRRSGNSPGNGGAGAALRPDGRWLAKCAINGLGAACTSVVTLVFAATKFADGAWFVLVLIPGIVLAFSAIRNHYDDIAAQLSLSEFGSPPRIDRQRVIMPISGVHRGTLVALRYARTLSHDVTAVHVSIDAAETERLRAKWDRWGEGVRLVILDSEFRLLLEPLLDYISEIACLRRSGEMITIVVPEFVPERQWHNLLHTRTAFILRLAFRNVPGVVIIDFPYRLVGKSETSGGGK
jgi:hypothetical protein